MKSHNKTLEDIKKAINRIHKKGEVVTLTRIHRVTKKHPHTIKAALDMLAKQDFLKQEQINQNKIGVVKRKIIIA